MFGLFKKFKDGLAKTVAAIAARTQGLFGGRRIDVSSLATLEEALYTADFGVATTGEVLAEIKEAYRRDPELSGRQAAEIGAAVLKRILQGSEGALTAAAQPPTVIALIGVNGSGKTTTTAKLAARLKPDGGVVVAACDTFRAAAIDQLRVWTERLKVDLVASQPGSDAASVAFDALQAARGRGCKWVLVDTAGRLHNKAPLMAELAKIRRVIQKSDPSAPHHVWLVVDGSLGTNSIEQARAFHRDIGLTGLVVTKLDGTSRGGAIVGIWRELRLPIYFVGLGEAAEDLQPFDAASYASAVFGGEEAA